MIVRYTQIVREVSETATVRKFVSGIKERNEILADFASGRLEALTSMKCLEEGVDVPRSEVAIFCASTGNPRQFIQRCGRILRTHPDKKFAVTHDLMVAPEVNSTTDNYRMERSLWVILHFLSLKLFFFAWMTYFIIALLFSRSSLVYSLMSRKFGSMFFVAIFVLFCLSLAK